MNPSRNIDLNDPKLIREYCRYSLDLYLGIELNLKEIHGQNAPTWLVQETFKGALRPFVYTAEELQKNMKPAGTHEAGSSEARKEHPSEIDELENWRKAMSRKYGLDFTNPRRVRKTRKLDNGEFKECLTKMAAKGYLESDGDFILPEGKYE